MGSLRRSPGLNFGVPVEGGLGPLDCRAGLAATAIAGQAPTLLSIASEDQDPHRGRQHTDQQIGGQHGHQHRKKKKRGHEHSRCRKRPTAVRGLLLTGRAMLYIFESRHESGSDLFQVRARSRHRNTLLRLSEQVDEAVGLIAPLLVVSEDVDVARIRRVSKNARLSFRDERTYEVRSIHVS